MQAAECTCRFCRTHLTVARSATAFSTCVQPYETCDQPCAPLRRQSATSATVGSLAVKTMLHGFRAHTTIDRWSDAGARARARRRCAAVVAAGTARGATTPRRAQ